MKTVTTYVAEDGKEFEDQKKCREYEFEQKEVLANRGTYIPKKEELAWFWMTRGNNNMDEWHETPILATYQGGGGVDGNYMVREFDRLFFSDCAKFIGEVPEPLRDRYGKEK